MAATIHEVLDGLGTWQLDLKTWDDVIAKQLPKNAVVLISEGERPLFPLLLLTRDPTEAKPSIGGQFPDWRLGTGDSGPLIESREYVAGTDRLANGDFSLGDLYYRFGSDTLWIIGDTGPASVTSDPLADDLLESDETFQTAPGHQYRLTIVSTRTTGAVGRLRARVLFEGRFKSPDLLAAVNGDFELGPGNGWGSATKLSIVNDPTNARTRTEVLKAEPLPQPDALTNGDFEAGPLSGWSVASNALLDPVSAIINDPSRSRAGDYVLLVGTTRKRAFAEGDMEGAWSGGAPDGWTDISLSGSSWSQSSTSHSGNYSARSEYSGSGGIGAVLEALSPPENVDGAAPHTTRAAEQERWRLTGYVANDIAASPPTDFHAWCDISLFKEDLSAETVLPTQFYEVRGGFTWQLVSREFVLPAGYSRIRLVLNASNLHGYWYFDDFTLERIEGNEEILTNDPVTVAPGEEWTLTVHARSGPAFLSGGLFPRVRLRGVKAVTTKALTSNVATLTLAALHDYIVGQKVVVSGVDATFDGTWVLTAVTSTTLSYALTHADVASTGATGTAGNPDILSELNPVSQTNNQWVATAKAITIPDGYDTAIVELRGRDITGEWIYVDDCTFVRTKGNTDTITHDPVPVIPGRSYRCKAQIRSGPAVTGGQVVLAFTLSAPGRDDITFEASQDATNNAWVELPVGFSPASGYDSLALAVRSEDILGDNFWVDDIRIIDDEDNKDVTDNKTSPVDLVIADPAPGSHTLEVTAPGGAQTVRVQLIVESQGGGWEVDEVHLQRIGEPIATVADIVADLLQDPDTADQLLTLGTVHRDNPISHDWLIENTHNRDALFHLLSGGVAPDLLEYRVNADLSVDVGAAADLYTDRDGSDPAVPAIVLTKDDLVVLEPPDLTEDHTTYVSHIKVIGAQRQTANGDTITITATSAVPWATPMLNDDGSSVTRTKIVTDSSVNHPLYAQQFADFLAAKEADTDQAVVLKLGDARARGGFDIGDWIYPYMPDAGLEDVNEMRATDGTPAFPKRSRVIERTLRLGDGDYKAEILVPGGEPIDITDIVKWETVTSADITVGSLVPSFTVDNEGGAAIRQFTKYRAALAR